MPKRKLWDDVVKELDRKDPNKLVIHRASVRAVSVATLRELCADNREHEYAVIFEEATKEFDDSVVVNVQEANLKAIVENVLVEVEREVSPGGESIRHTVIEPESAKPKAPAKPVE